MTYCAHESSLWISHVHSAAICEEIGETLRIYLNRQAVPLPPQLHTLMRTIARRSLLESTKPNA
jgi:hypothetical protein